jgi:small ligand-binding sensory domain FIST
MKRFVYGHAKHPDGEIAARLVLAQLRGQLAERQGDPHPTLGLIYCTDHFGPAAAELLAMLGAEMPEVTDWAGTVGVGIAATNVEYVDEPALAVMLCDLPADQYRVFSGVAPLGQGFDAQTALVHADGETPELTELLGELAERTLSGQVFGGLTASHQLGLQLAQSSDHTVRGQGHSSGVFDGGLSGVAFGPNVKLLTRVTQGCLPIGQAHTITEAQHNLVLQLDGQPALDVLMNALGVSLAQPEAAIEAVRATLAGLSAQAQDSPSQLPRPLITRTGHFVDDVRVRHIIGLDPARGGVVLADTVEAGMRLAFCKRDVQAARADLVRICAELREELETEQTVFDTVPERDEPAAAPQAAMAGAIYISCVGRGGAHFGGDSAELQIIRHALGDVPLVGFFAGGEIAHQHIYGYTGVLTVFAAD